MVNLGSGYKTTKNKTPNNKKAKNKTPDATKRPITKGSKLNKNDQIPKNAKI